MKWFLRIYTALLFALILAALAGAQAPPDAGQSWRDRGPML